MAYDAAAVCIVSVVAGEGDVGRHATVVDDGASAIAAERHQSGRMDAAADVARHLQVLDCGTHDAMERCHSEPETQYVKSVLTK